MIHSFLRIATLALLAATGLSAQAAPCPATSVAPTTTLPAATVGVAYSQTFTASNSNALPFAYAITSGLPAGSGLGLVPDGPMASLSGAPTQVGNYLITVTATDSSGCSGGRVYALSIGQGSQSIGFTSPAPAGAAIGGTPYSVTATASSGLPVSFAIDASASSVCSIAGSSVSFQSAGTCTINANQAGNANYAAAPQAQQSFGVGLASQTISFTSTAPAAASVGGAVYSVAASATSGLAVTFSVDASASSVCSVAGSSVSFLAAGTCVVNANQNGNASFNAAPQVQQSFAVGAGSQSISFTSTAPAAAVVAGSAYSVAATATSGLPVSFSVDAGASSICAIAGSSVTFQSVGTCVLNANQAGNANYTAAPQVQQSFAVGIGSQSISFSSTAPAAAVVGGAAYTVSATATSGLAVAFSIDASASSVCSVTGSTVIFQAAGSCVINANQAGNANYAAAPQAQQTFAVGAGSQSIFYSSTAPAAATVAGAAYTVTATASSGLPVSFSIDASASGVCAIAGSSVSFTGAGTCTINANQAGNASYNPAPQVQQSFAVGRGNQSISFSSTAPAAATVAGTAYTVSATATSGLPVSFSIDASASAVCTISGASVSFTGAGTCVINANQAGNANYNAAPQVQQSFSVGRGSQSISFSSTAPAAATVAGAAYTVSATASSGLPVSFSIDASASAVCTIAGASVSFSTVGTCVINANQAGNANYNAAAQLQQSFAVGKGSQTLSFTSTAPTAAVVGGAAYTVTASATSGLTASFSIDASASSVCSIAGASVSFQSAGSCVINANQAGNANYNAATQVQQTFVVGKGSQTLSYTSTAPAGAVVGGAVYTVTASATSGLAASFSIDASAGSVCSIAGASVSFTGAGTCVINANQAGNANYNAAPQVQQSFTVGKGSQAISYTSTAPVGAVVGGAAYTVTATSSAGLTVAFSIDASASGVCSIAGASVSFHGVGTCVVNANQAGNANYNAAPQVQQSFAVGKGNQSIAYTSTAPATAVVGGPAYTVAATSTAGLAVAFGIDASASSVCTIAGSSVSFIGVGTCVINANQAGNANYNAAPQVQQSFAVGKGSQSISYTSPAPTTAVVAGPAYTVTATSSAGLPVVFSIDASASSVCSITGASVSFQSAGTCVINADQAGNASYNAAPTAQQSFSVGRGSQIISFTSTAPTAARVGGPTYTVSATATSGLAVSFSIDASASAVCSISGSTVSFLGSGTCMINAGQAGDSNWNAAPQVQQSFAVSACLDLAVGEVVVQSMPGGADFCLANSSGGPAEYTYLPINTGVAADSTLSLVANNIQAVTGPPSPRPAASPLAPLDQAVPAAEAHEHAALSPLPGGREIRATDLIAPRAGEVGPLTVGQLIDINASIGGCGIAPSIRKGRVEAIGTSPTAGQQVLYAVQEVVETTPGAADWHPPVVGGFASQDFQNIADAFTLPPPGVTAAASFSGTTTLLKTGAMDLTSTNLGALTDVDANGGVIVFYTRALNETLAPASSQSLPGLFQPRDLFSSASCAGSNQGEIIYMLVPDPTGSVNSNVRTVSSVYGFAGPALVHQAAHLANAGRRLYVAGAVALEDSWLGEALAWQMQEMVFLSTSVGLTPRANIQLSTLTTGPNASVRVAAFNTYQNSMYGTARTYFYQMSNSGGRRLGPMRPAAYSTGNHDAQAANFAHSYMFLRYAMDRLNSGDAALLTALSTSSLNGAANFQAVFGVHPNAWLPDFLLGAYIDDSGVAGVAAQYSLLTWNYRSVYGGLGGFPLVVDQLTNGVPLNFGLSTGGGARYTRFGIAAGLTATVNLTEGGVSPTSPTQTAIVRTK
ncbi:hypothetical protein DFR29_10187 [Tahibacter aquaticus]|uniref:Uncharacterized protein n=1 Tax=Tahibacter aquaticus TaxID=520092 RepID=A0A4R6Z977_9GAMM|nr:hypothetical protein [Tahibacter aquaticus]TDR48467.1 hypothetical protein DFR29_10187 [Tahibacter aquaticus]